MIDFRYVWTDFVSEVSQAPHLMVSDGEMAFAQAPV